MKEEMSISFAEQIDVLRKDVAEARTKTEKQVGEMESALQKLQKTVEQDVAALRKDLALKADINKGGENFVSSDGRTYIVSSTFVPLCLSRFWRLDFHWHCLFPSPLRIEKPSGSGSRARTPILLGSRRALLQAARGEGAVRLGRGRRFRAPTAGGIRNCP